MRIIMQEAAREVKTALKQTESIIANYENGFQLIRRICFVE